MSRVVRPCAIAAKASKTSFSLRGSRAAVGSSRMSTRESRYRARTAEGLTDAGLQSALHAVKCGLQPTVFHSFWVGSCGRECTCRHAKSKRHHHLERPRRAWNYRHTEEDNRKKGDGPHSF